MKARYLKARWNDNSSQSPFCIKEKLWKSKTWCRNWVLGRTCAHLISTNSSKGTKTVETEHRKGISQKTVPNSEHATSRNTQTLQTLPQNSERLRCAKIWKILRERKMNWTCWALREKDKEILQAIKKLQWEWRSLVQETWAQGVYIASRNSQTGHQEKLFKGKDVKRWHILARLLNLWTWRS